MRKISENNEKSVRKVKGDRKREWKRSMICKETER